MSIILVLIVAISLSMDAFSLSLAYGTLNIEKKNISLLSIIVGIYHFIMPILGMYVGDNMLKHLLIMPNTLVFIVLVLIGIQMIISSFKENKTVNDLNILEMLIFGLAVSLDSFTLGLGLKVIYKYPIISALIFSVVSFFFTYLGLNIGKKIEEKIGKISTICGGITLIIIGIMYAI